ncbi:NADH-quinone oxidoreductase subunit NuoN [Rhodobacter sp. NTK016B]|uniref:NADH-quinone oxidoreductase subunit NuoN n=1 Tax=Rhodobacter sp. NTK016B TaxID=2759676 RepID=UPI001A8E1098|nr:NADH-quinone oxidoreductase subunit NuoN [Rhodobacter sp. NTK016B]MBN8291626.1 NADH-quinone oxidoreductase subunit NuoN [Rhodobacter sp. NTK016B]
MTSVDLSIALPEILLSLWAMVALLAGAYFGKDRLASALTWATVAVFILIAVLVGVQDLETHEAFGGLFVEDSFARFAKMAMLLAGAAVLVMGMDYLERAKMMKFEYPILVALSMVGMMVMVSAQDLITLYMGLELQSLALYVLAAFRRDSVKATEAGLKYFVLGALASGLLLYGASLTYGYAGTTRFDGIASVITGEHLPVGLLMGLAFMLAGLAFKVSAVPFHMWTPDVYEGAPTPVTAFFATAPKVAAMALLTRLVIDAFGAVPGDWGQIVGLLAGLSMVVGAVGALGQRNLKRLMAYSSITHMGFALLGVTAGTEAGVKATLLYMAIYLTMSVGVFAFMLTMRREGRVVSSIDDLNMLSKTQPIQALAMLVLFFSLAGVPPFLGFWAKFAVLSAVISSGYVFLAVVGVISSVIAAFYYIRVVYFMYFGTEGDPLDNDGAPAQRWMTLGAAAITILGVINLFGIEGAAAVAAQALVQ